MTQPALHLFELAESPFAGPESLSPFCLKANRALRARGLSYTRHHLTRPDGHRFTAERRQVPVLVVGALDAPVPDVVADSTAILHRIGELTGRPFEPGESRARSETWLYEELADTALNGFLVAARWADDRNWPAVSAAYFAGAPWPVRALLVPRMRAHVITGLRARDVWRAGPEACWERYETLIARLADRAPERGFWVSAEITAADLGLFAQLAALRSELTPWQRDVIERHAGLCRYVDRVDAATRERPPLAVAA